MSLAINNVELAVGNFTDVVKLFEGANGDTRIKVSLRDLRQLVNCYPALNKIVNDPEFTCNKP
jgi:hypothetical protein